MRTFATPTCLRDIIAPMSPQPVPEGMTNFDAIIKRLWPEAVNEVQKEHVHDKKALDALRNKGWPDRRDTIRGWLQSYSVFRVRGIATQKDKIAVAILAWADSNDDENLSDLGTLCAAHQELMDRVCDAYVHECQNKRRDFISLSSKALWLRYPNDVPMYDSYAQRALWVLAKLQPGLKPTSVKAAYVRFASVWKQLYERHRGTIDGLDMGGYEYRVRVFDRILWMLGTEQYFL